MTRKRHHAEEEDMEGDERGEARAAGNLMAPALVSVLPGGSILVVAIGAGLRVVNLSTEEPVTLIDETTPKRHGNAIRAIAFDPSGRLFASAGDDKLVKLWDTSSWTCLRTMRAQKKISALAFSRDGLWLTFADKFGTLNVSSTTTSSSSTTDKAMAKVEEPVQLLAHCCSIICDLAMSPDGRYIASADRDYKIRVSILPANPLAGAHEIQSFCLGHTFFVGCVAFISGKSEEEEGSSRPLLVSGAGDGTVRLWEPESGKLLDTYHITPQYGARKDVDAEDPAAVVAMAVNDQLAQIAVCLERETAVTILGCDVSKRELRLLQRVEAVGRGEAAAPATSMAFDHEGRLWLVSGAAQALESDDHVPTPDHAAAAEAHAAALAAAAAVQVTVLQPRRMLLHPPPGQSNTAVTATTTTTTTTSSGEDDKSSSRARERDAQSGCGRADDDVSGENGGGAQETTEEHLVSGAGKGGGDDVAAGAVVEVVQVLYEVVEMPGGGKMKQSLEGSARDAALAAAAAEAAATALKSQMSKKVYEEREGRKRARNDKKAQATGNNADECE